MKIIESKQVCVVIGETGSGKSTQLVQFLYEAGYATNGMIVCTQPRKLAAISLAEHVSKEVGEKIGDTYGYVTTKNKQNKKAKVIYMTDHSLLNECIADPNLSKYSCLVIDEAHERSIHTDILIALIKRCLPKREDLKVIITSATINPTLFSHYFGGKETCPVIEVPGRVYPVKIEWEEGTLLSSIEQDSYVADAVNKVHNIHISQRKDLGDILVFLTCPAEIEKACKLAQKTLKNEAVILPLHGKLQPEEQQKVFDIVKGKRKVVFSTNVAETSVTIPGIKYVIDTGLSKELCYDPQKNMNSLEIRPISKSSANQRKGRAGRTAPGDCYRLYSQSDYDTMRDDSVPEILRITLAFAVIKLYEFGIKDIHSFEFVEAPKKKALDDAVDNLRFLGAMKDGRLTKLGRKMALLPLEPNLSKVLFDAINKEIGIEAAIAVSISTLAGKVFFRPTDEESKSESDRKRLPFCQQSGDQMTYLHTYFEWSRQAKQKRNKWCVENYVNAKSMRMVQQTVEELRFILKQKCKIMIPPNVESLDKASEILPRLYFNAFLRNICVHLGHNKIGYWCERLPDEQLIIYYGSSLHYLSSIPQCVIYEKTQKTTQHFMLQALPVREEWIQDAIRTGQLQCHPAESSLFKFYQVHPISFANLGPYLSSKLFQKYPQYRELSEFYHFDIPPVFEHSRQHGTLVAYCQECYHDQLLKLLVDFIESIKKELKEESHEYGIVSDNDDARIVIGEGGSIQHLLMPDHFRTVMVTGLTSDYSVAAATDELTAYGECTDYVKFTQNNSILLFIKYEDPANAVLALNHQFDSFSDPTIVIKQHRERNRNKFCLRVEWCRRRRRGYGFINFEEDDFISYLCPSFGPFCMKADALSGIKFYIKQETQSIKFDGISQHATEGFVWSRLLAKVPYLDEVIDIDEVDIFFIYEPPFEETDESYTEQKQSIDENLARSVARNEYYIDFFRPRVKNVKYTAMVYFNDSVTCLKALEGLEDEEEEEYTVQLSLSSKVRYSSQIFSVIKESIQELSDHYSKAEEPATNKM